jgi:tRNA pseudouridine38-40 synthase
VPRFALELEYDGSAFVGWQRQKLGVSVQAVLEQAAAKLVEGAAVASVAAGRTDAGVHASAMVVHLDLHRDIPPNKLRDALNYHMLPHAICVLRAALAAPNWNARFSATGRHYRYRILNRDARPVMDLHRVWHVREGLDLDAMQRAAAILVGHHDFTSFRAASCQAKSPVRTLEQLDVTRQGEFVEIAAAARSFLHHQVRNMVGTLKLVGAGRWTVERVADALEARRRNAAGPTAPPQGLCLIEVVYPEPVFI